MPRDANAARRSGTFIFEGDDVAIAVQASAARPSRRSE
jgi:hypothetical protein